MLTAALVVANGEVLRVFHEHREPQAAFESVMERGFAGVDAAIMGTPYT